MNDHALGVFALSLAFAAPLMRFMPRVPGFMFELVGENGAGKSALVQLMASTIGDPRLYQTSLSASVTGMAEMMARHNDLPLVLDEAERLMASGDLKGLRQAYLTLAYPPTNRAGGMPDSNSTRGLWGLGLLATSASLRTTVKSASSNDDLITLNVPSSTRVSVFPEIPERYSDSAAFIDTLLRAAATNHGSAYRHFLVQLVEEAQQNPTELATRLQGWQNHFMKKANIAADDGAGFKLARVFAGIYAAGRQAGEYGAIPKCAERSTFLLECFALANRATTASLSFKERLEALRRSDRVLTITRPREDPVQMEAATKALGTIKVTATCHELRISPHRILEAFPDWQQLERSDEVKEFLVMDGRNLKAKAKLAPGLPNERLYRFKLPVASESLFDDAREAGS